MSQPIRLYSDRIVRIAGTDHAVSATVKRDGRRWLATEILNGIALDSIRTATKREAIEHAAEAWDCYPEGVTP